MSAFRQLPHGPLTGLGDNLGFRFPVSTTEGGTRTEAESSLIYTAVLAVGFPGFIEGEIGTLHRKYS